MQARLKPVIQGLTWFMPATQTQARQPFSRVTILQMPLSTFVSFCKLVKMSKSKWML